MQGIMDLASKYSLSIVEDAACGFGAYQEDKHVGTLATQGALVFTLENR